MNFITKLFGKQAPAAAVVVDHISLIEAERDAALTAGAAAKAKLADLATLTAKEHAEAETAQEEARRAVERANKQIEDLRAEQAAAEAREEREAFDRDVAAHKRQIEDVSARIEREYPGLAAPLAALMQAEHECVRRGEALAYQGRKFGKH